MGKGGKGKGRAKPASKPEAEDGDDALLAAAMEEAAAAKSLAEEKAEEEAIAAMEEQLSLRPTWSAASIQEACAKLDRIPTFCVMSESNGSKKFLPLRFADEDSKEPGPETCACFIDPREAHMTLLQAQKGAPDLSLAVGVLSLGKALALAEGWAAAQGAAPFSLRASLPLRKKFGPLLTRQLEQKKIKTFWHLPVFLCQELQSPTVLPVFLDPDDVASTWRKTGRTEPVPTRLTCLDLRLVVHEMLKSLKEAEGVDWSNVRFVGTEAGWKAVEQGFKQMDAAHDAAVADGSEPPPLEPDPQTEL